MTTAVQCARGSTEAILNLARIISLYMPPWKTDGLTAGDLQMMYIFAGCVGGK